MLLLVWTLLASSAYAADTLVAESFRTSDGLVEIRCEANQCSVELDQAAAPAKGSSLRTVENGQEAYLFQNADAERLYRALTLAEYVGNYGASKELLPDSPELSLRCNRWPTGLGDAFSCSIRVGLR